MRQDILEPKIEYLRSLLPSETPSALKAREASLQLDRLGISMGPEEAHLMGFFIRLLNCRKFVEIGTLTGYSGLKILENLPPDGHLWTLEKNPQFATLARQHFDEAGYQNRYTLLIGSAEEQVHKLNLLGPFDGVFIDANKSAYPTYLAWAKEALKPGGLIIADNTLLKGVVPDSFEASSLPPSKMVLKLREFNQHLSDPRWFDSILIPTQEGLSVALLKKSNY